MRSTRPHLKGCTVQQQAGCEVPDRAATENGAGDRGRGGGWGWGWGWHLSRDGRNLAEPVLIHTYSYATHTKTDVPTHTLIDTVTDTLIPTAGPPPESG